MALGATHSLVNNASLGLLNAVANDKALTGNKAYVEGKIGGDVVSTVFGAQQTSTGVSMAVGGTVLGLAAFETGVGLVTGGTVAVGGVAEAVYGTEVTVHSLSNLQNDTMSLAKIKNGGLAGQSHPVSGVPFNSEGYPVFDSKFDAKLDPSLNKASDRVQFKEANNQLKNAIENNPNEAKQFTKDQLNDIANGKTPKGYTWHHHQDDGKMQLVESDPHKSTGHTGGRSTWGGGSDNR